MARILITGAGGYIGSYLAKWLHERGHTVSATARTITPLLEEALDGCEIRALDVLDIPVGFDGEWDCAIHAATANDVLSRDFRAGVELSTFGTRNVLDLARRSSIPHVVFFSTLQVYGTELSGTITEESSPIPNGDYALNHVFGEMVCRLEALRSGIRTTLLRPANIYGCPVSRSVERWTLVPMCFVREALATGRITLRSSGLQRRDFVSLRQVAAACEQVVEAPGVGCAVKNIAGGGTHSILEAAQWTVTAFKKAGLAAPEIQVLDDSPNVGNNFDARSSITPDPLGGGVGYEMISEITKLIEYFQTADQASLSPS